MNHHQMLISYLNANGIRYKLPEKSELDNDPLNKVLCLGMLSTYPRSRLSHTNELFNLIIQRPSYGDTKNKCIPKAILLAVKYYNIRIIYDADHSRNEYIDELAKMKDNELKDVILILNHVYNRADNIFENIDYIVDYSPEFAISKGLISKKYHHKVKETIYSTIVNMPHSTDRPPKDVEEVLKTRYILAGGKNRREYSKIAEACNNLKVNLVICDTNISNHDIQETKYVKTMSVSPEVFNVLIEHSLFVACPAIKNNETPIGITVISKAYILGKVCISTLDAGVDCYIDNGRTGFIIKNTVDEFQKVISYLIDDDNRAEMENRIDRNKYTEEGAKKRVEKFIRDILDE